MARIRTIGTDAVQAMGDNDGRRAWTIIMPATTIVAGNTGRVHVGLGFQPSTVVSAPDQGFALVAGEQIGDEMIFEGDISVWQGSIWLRANVAGQIVWIDEAIGGVAIAPTS